MKVGILGGGITGVAIQHFLRHESEVLEGASRIGGLCQTIWKDGFGYDLGGHILFTKNEAIDRLVKQLLGENINYCRRANKIWYKGRFVKGWDALREEIFDRQKKAGVIPNDAELPARANEVRDEQKRRSTERQRGARR